MAQMQLFYSSMKTNFKFFSPLLSIIENAKRINKGELLTYEGWRTILRNVILSEMFEMQNERK